MTDVHEYKPDVAEDQLPIADARDDRNFCCSYLDYLKSKQGTGPYLIASINPGSAPFTREFTHLTEMRRWVEVNQGKTNFYRHANKVNPRRRPYSNKSEGGDGTTTRFNPATGEGFYHADMGDVFEFSEIPIDIDCHGRPETFERARARVLQVITDKTLLQKHGIPDLPSEIIDSGRGYWAVWEFEPVQVNGADHAAELSLYGRFIADVLRPLLDNDELGIKVDSSFDLCRLVRLVGTKNINSADHRMAALVPPSGQIYQLHQFTKADPSIVLGSPGAMDVTRIARSIGKPLTVPGNDLTEKVDWLIDAGIALETINLIAHMRYSEDSDRVLPKRDGGLVDRSSVYHRVNIALQYDERFPLERILGIFLDKEFKISESFYQPRKVQRGKEWIAAQQGYEISTAAATSTAKRQIARVRAKFEAGFFSRTCTLEENLAKERGDVLAGKAFGPEVPATADVKKAAEAAKPKSHRRTFTGKENLQENGDKGLYRNEHNVLAVIAKLGGSLRKNELTGDVILTGIDAICGSPSASISITDDEMIDLKLLVERRYRFEKPLGKDQFYDWVCSAARANKFHPVLDYLDGLVWDGEPRLNNWLIDHAGAKDDGEGYIQAVSSLIMIAAVRRVRQPGCKFDEMLVMESPQGKNKSAGLRALCADPDWFTDSPSLGASPKEMIEQLQGSWIVEIAELQRRKDRDMETIKAQLSRQEDKARLAYGRITSKVKRQSVFFGTTNLDKYLEDPTGGRRFWPVRVDAFNLETLTEARDQLWAEAAHREAEGESIRLAESLWAVAERHQKERAVTHPWEEIIARLFGYPDQGFVAKGMVLVNDLFDKVLGIHTEKRSVKLGIDLKNVMKTLGFYNERVSLGGCKDNYYIRETKEFILDVRQTPQGLTYDIVHVAERALFHKQAGATHEEKLRTAMEKPLKLTARGPSPMAKSLLAHMRPRDEDHDAF